jgi:hypothetical protein
VNARILLTQVLARGVQRPLRMVLVRDRVQKSIGPWTAYGGGGYWINPSAHNRNWWFTGLVVQCEVLPGVTPGIEVFHGTSQVIGGPREVGLNFGLIWDLGELQHVIFSAGPALEGTNQLQGYFAYQLTFGP